MVGATDSVLVTTFWLLTGILAVVRGVVDVVEVVEVVEVGTAA